MVFVGKAKGWVKAKHGYIKILGTGDYMKLMFKLHGSTKRCKEYVKQLCMIIESYLNNKGLILVDGGHNVKNSLTLARRASKRKYKQTHKRVN